MVTKSLEKLKKCMHCKPICRGKPTQSWKLLCDTSRSKDHWHMGADWKGQSLEEDESVTLWGKEIFKSNTKDILPRHWGEKKTQSGEPLKYNRRNEGKEERERWKNRGKEMWSALQRNTMAIPCLYMEEKGSEKPSHVWESSLCGEHYLHSAAEKVPGMDAAI